MGNDTHNIDEILVKVSGRLPVGRKLEMGEDVTLEIIGSVVKEEATDNQDGTVNICYVVKGLTLKVL